jgi:hypothetical protein
LYPNSQANVRWSHSPDEKLWYLQIALTTGAPEGDCKFTQVELMDNAGNQARYLNDVKAFRLDTEYRRQGRP